MLTRSEQRTADPARADTWLRRAGAPSTLALERDGPPFSFGLACVGDDDVALARYSLEGDWAVRTELDLFVVASGRSGDARWEARGASGAFEEVPVLFGPGEDVVHVDGRAEVLEVQFTRPALARFAADHYGVEHVRFADVVPRSLPDAQAAYWREVLRYVEVFADSDAVEDDLLRAALKRNLAVTVLRTFVPVVEQRAWRLTSAVAQRRLRAAKAFIDEHLAEPITPDDVAKAVSLPHAVLDERFREQTGSSIAQRLAAARADQARGEVLRADPTEDERRAIARRWGFRDVPAMVGAIRAHHPAWAPPRADGG